MALVLADRVRDTTTTTGTGTVTLSGTAPTGYQTFGATIGNGNTTYYTINAGSQWEVGIGTYSSTGPTLARTTVLASSNSGSLVDFSTGTKDVFVTYPAEKSVNQDASGNVGIGTSSPTRKLSVVGAGNTYINVNSGNDTSVAGILFGGTTSPSNGQVVYDNSANSMTFVVGGSGRAVINSSGNVGIGTSSPASRFTVNSGAAGVVSNFTDGVAQGLALVTGTGYFGFYNPNYGAITFRDGSNGAENVRITDSGNVGIGTSSPDAKLDILGPSGDQIRLRTAETEEYRIGRSTSTGYLDFYGSQTGYTGYTFGGVNGERMRIDSAGKVGIGTSAPTDLLTVSNGSIASTIAGSGAGLQMGRIAMYSSALGAAYTNYGGEIRSYSGAGIDVSDLRFYTANAAATAERMRIDSSGNLLVGGTTPLGKIHLQGDVNGNIDTWIRNDNAGSSSRAGLVLNASGNSWRMGMGSSANNGNALTWNVDIGGANTERMRIDTSGNASIGTTAGLARLRVSAAASVNAPVLGNVTNYPAFFSNGDAGYGLGVGTSGVDGHVWLQAQRSDSATAYNITLNEAGGNVGIGTASPSVKFQVVGTARVNQPGATRYRSDWYLESGNAYMNGFDDTGGVYIPLSLNFNSYTFNSGGSERMRIDTSGNLLVGTTGNGLSAKMVVETTTNAANAVFSMTRNGAFDNVTFYHQYAYDSNAAVQCRFLNTNAVSIGSITSSGTATAFNTSSDYRLKDIDGPIANSGAYIDALKPVQGSWKADGSRFIGLLAHEVQEVSETPIATGEKDGEEMQAMDYSAPELIANLIAEIQSLRARVAQLEGN